MLNLRTGTAFIGILLAALAALAFVWLELPVGGEPGYEGPAPKTAVIVDQLQSTSPDQAFVDDVTRTLVESGYTVDYVPGKDVTVDYYRELPSQGYGLVIVRAHSGFVLRDPGDTDPQEPFLFSSEPYSDDAHGGDQESRRLSVAYYLTADLETVAGDPGELLERFKDEPRYFGIKPSFVQSSMQGAFPGSMIVLMGCSGLATNELARAFIEKGARAVVGWDDLVSAQHTDDATERLLERMLGDGLPTAEAVSATAADVGADPTYGGQLVYYE